jgi:hypothetical protein
MIYVEMLFPPTEEFLSGKRLASSPVKGLPAKEALF